MRADVIDELNRCPVCHGGKYQKYRDAFDDRYGYGVRFSLARCLQCGHFATLPRLCEEELPRLYGAFYPRKKLTAEQVGQQAAKAFAPFARLFRWWMGTDNQGQYHSRAGETVLDVGCGSGFSLLVAKGLGAEAYGIEADPNVQALASDLGLHVHQGNIQDNPFPGVSFDLVVLNQVIEHIPEPDHALKIIANRLVSGGRVILVFPNRSSFWRRITGPKWIHWHVPYHLHHFNKNTFERLACRCGFRVMKSRSITPNLWSLLQVRAIMARPRLGEPGSLWGTKGGARGAGSDYHQPLHRHVKSIIRSVLLALFGIPNRCIDLLGWGDCLMVELKREKDL